MRRSGVRIPEAAQNPCTTSRVWYFDAVHLRALSAKLASFIEMLLGSSRRHVSGLLVLGLGFLPGVFKESFWSDDYSGLREVNATAMHTLRDARPVYAAVLKFSYAFVIHSPGEGWRLRLMGFMGLISLFLYAVNKLPEDKHRNFLVIGLATAFCTSSFQMQVHWASAWIMTWVSLLAWVAFDSWNSNFRFHRALSVFLMCIALLTYPLAAVFFVSAVAVIGVLNGDASRVILERLMKSLFLVLIGTIISTTATFLAFKLLHVQANQRVGLVAFSEVPTKLIWFITRPIVIGLRPFQISSPDGLHALLSILPVVLLFVLGTFVTQRLRVGSAIFRVAVVGMSMSASLFPLLVTSPNEFEFRMISGYAWSVVVLVFFYTLCLVETSAWIRNHTLRMAFDRLAYAVLICLTLIGIVSVNQNYHKFIGEPYEKKTAFLLSAIKQCSMTQLANGVTVLPPISAFASTKNLGLYSMTTDLQSDWVPKDNVEILLKSEGIRANVSYSSQGRAQSRIFKNECLIDLEKFRLEIL